MRERAYNFSVHFRDGRGAHTVFKVKVKVKNTLFNLGMVTYSYERQDIIQYALKRLPGG
jgi:hypothetical protein